MSRSLKGKINKLENSILERPKLGTSKMLIENENEIAVWDRANLIIASGRSYHELSPEELKIIDSLTEITWVRALDIFNSVIGGMIAKGSKHLEAVFSMWLCYFLDEAITGLNQMFKEEAIMEDKGKSWKQKEKELDELAKEWVTIFTRERFEAYISDFIERGLRPEIRANLEKERKKNVKAKEAKT